MHTPVYRFWTIKARQRQLIKAGYGFGPYPVLADALNGIMDMDAPDCLPAGSTIREEQTFTDSKGQAEIYVQARESICTRSRMASC
jgi:hypothetical protein